MKLINFILLLSAVGITISGCSNMKTTKDKRDPFENYNRGMYSFNDKAYDALTPVAKGYDYVMPDSVQTGIFNMFQNLLEPARVVNDMFQGQLSYAGDDSIRFLTNTTFGVLGFFDVADDWFGKQMRYHQSFAVTLHKWGVYDENEASPYVVWPLLGPGTLEDVANGVDALFNPLTYVFFFAPIGTAASYIVTWGIYGTYQINQGVAYLPAYSNLKEVSIDPYIAMRNAYLQNYDYGMAKILKQELKADSDALETDKAVLGVLGYEGDNVASQMASSGNVSTNKSVEPPMMLKSKLDKINEASQVDEAFDQSYSNDSKVIDLANLDGDTKANDIDESKDISIQLRNAKAELPGNADDPQTLIQTIKEQD
ncbi:MlaA family lipoprotein [Allofrancisella frigidaquae]|uniref:VacJ family lipoprotein n=1 Tax=Allofrancisella frigidaquae TaxID=1085644 RepID=A0A6M3HSS2_9GAMM|nr:VacJ family lipoprotein [Allofrancisella frigidaquae]QIV94157.1 VacJ family lipoprotein [Allofrancisella frigidaquae]